ncbi:hypothetical protein BROUX41_003570 [Berkeleyomyces rouxiae]|uniref:uncharacterized protein n=1 Tax=Berkeleyomyces rouxiae TaxID=2035830 RepID=UPI003B7E5BB1
MGGTFAKRTITKTRRKTRDLDQIKADLLSPKHLEQFKSLKASEDLPGLGRHYCLECAKWFETEFSLIAHRKGKPHKRRVKALGEEAYSQREAEAAVGLRTDNKGSEVKSSGNDDVEMNS